MGGPFPQEFVEAVRDAGDIVQLISDYVPLKAAGSRMKGLCPFHDEKTPSFSVDPTRQLFYCFGCQTGGDIFKFVMFYEKIGFSEALEFLANRWGVPVPARTQGGDLDPRDRLVQMNETALKFYRGLLLDERSGNRCREYLASRGLGDETCKKLELGLSPSQQQTWDGLYRHLMAKRFKPAEAEAGGLAMPRKSGNGHYDRFRDRLIFPIRDAGGKCVAFGGRTLIDHEAKYINSPETPAYTKGNHLYGLHLSREAIRREGLAVMVEGYLDLAALLQAGFDNVVASLGTALTPSQARLLSRYTNRVVVSYDGDAAGAAATRRSLDMLLEKGFEVRVVELPAGMDPDDCIRKQGADAYGTLLRQAPPYLQFLLDTEARARDLDKVQEKIAAVNAVLPHLVKLNNSIERVSWATRMADTLRIDEGLVQQELQAALKVGRPRIRERAPQRETHVREAEARLISLLLLDEEQRDYCVEALDWADLEGSPILPIMKTIVERVHNGEPVDYPQVLEALTEDADRQLLTRIAFRDEPDEGPSAEDCLWAFKLKRLRREERDLTREIGEVQQSQANTEPAEHQPDDWTDEQLNRLLHLARKRDAM